MKVLTETDVVTAAVALIKATQVPVPNTIMGETELLKARVYNRWIFNMTVGQVMSFMQADADDGRINGWAVTMQSWVPSNIKSEKGLPVTPRNFTPGFDDAPGGADLAINREYKKRIDGVLKIWQVFQHDLGDDEVNSEFLSSAERDAVISSFDKAPRLGINWPDFEHDGLKFPAIAVLPGGDTSLHIAQGNVPFSFSYVVTAT